MFEPKWLATTDNAGYNDIRDEHIERVVESLLLTGCRVVGSKKSVCTCTVEQELLCNTGEYLRICKKELQLARSVDGLVKAIKKNNSIRKKFKIQWKSEGVNLNEEQFDSKTFEHHCYKCGIDPDNFTEEDLNKLQAELNK